jgi:hypothetical protein
MLSIYGIKDDRELKCGTENILTMAIDYYQIFNTFGLWLNQTVCSKCFLHQYTI